MKTGQHIMSYGAGIYHITGKGCAKTRSILYSDTPDDAYLSFFPNTEKCT